MFTNMCLCVQLSINAITCYSDKFVKKYEENCAHRQVQPYEQVYLMQLTTTHRFHDMVCYPEPSFGDGTILDQQYSFVYCTFQEILK